MTRIRLAGGRIIDPASGRDAPGDLLIDDDRIVAVGDVGETGEAETVLDCTGLLVVPGLIDVHVHLREAPFSDSPDAFAETVAGGAAAAVAGGFTTVCAMPNTTPPIDSADAVAWYVERATQANLARVLPVGCMTRGRDGRAPADLAAMRNAGACAFSDDGADVADDAVFEQVLREAARIGMPVLCHCENAAVADGGVLHDSPIATALGLPGLSRDAEDVAVARACDAALRTGCRVHVQHVSTEGAVEAVRRAKADAAPVTAEATPHHLTLTVDALAGRDTVFKVNPPLRSGHDVDAVLAAVRDGTIDCLASDHAPHTREAKARRLAEAPFGMIGLESALGVYATTLLETPLMTWPELIARMTTAPASVLGIDAGTLAVGARADVTVIDPAARWTIDPERFASKARNCPFAGREVKGRVVRTLVGGRVVYEAKP
ncbi:MAG TPA: dihydroorotase [Phycisphaerae bacterium]|nr:dihydroorotase [Phycisphaerae bacterium]